MLHVRYLGLMQLVIENLYPLTNITQFPSTPALDSHHPTVSIRLDSTNKGDYAIFVFLCVIYFT